MDGLWFAWEMGWKIGLNRHMIGQMAMQIMKFDKTWWTRGHGMFSPHEEGGLLITHAPLSKNYLLLQGNPKFTKLGTQD
jgi:hypothetical protein